MDLDQYTDTFGLVWRDSATPLLPASGPHEPRKSEIRAIGMLLDGTVSQLLTLIESGAINPVKSTKAKLDAALAYPADTIGMVVADATAANNGFYEKSGTSGSGSWSKVASLPDIAGLTTTLQGYLDTELDSAVNALDAAKANKTVTIAGAGLATGSGNLSANVTITVTAANAAEALGGVVDTKVITPLTLKVVTDPIGTRIGDAEDAIDALADIVDGKAAESITIAGAGLAVGGGDLGANRTITVPAANNAEAIAGNITDKALTPAAGKAALDAATAPLTEAVAEVRSEIAQTQGRPGDAIARYTLTLTGSGPAGAAPPGATVTNADGAARRLTGAGVLALRERIGLEAGRRYAIRAVLRRATDPTDPAGDTVRLGIQWLDNAKAEISQTVLHQAAIDVADGLQAWDAVIADTAGAGVDIAWPANARYAVPYIQTYGADGVTDAEVLAWADDTASIAIGAAQAAADTANGRLDVFEPGYALRGPVSQRAAAVLLVDTAGNPGAAWDTAGNPVPLGNITAATPVYQTTIPPVRVVQEEVEEPAVGKWQLVVMRATGEETLPFPYDVDPDFGVAIAYNEQGQPCGYLLVCDLVTIGPKTAVIYDPNTGFLWPADPDLAFQLSGIGQSNQGGRSSLTFRGDRMSDPVALYPDHVVMPNISGFGPDYRFGIGAETIDLLNPTDFTGWAPARPGLGKYNLTAEGAPIWLAYRLHEKIRDHLGFRARINILAASKGGAGIDALSPGDEPYINLMVALRRAAEIDWTAGRIPFLPFMQNLEGESNASNTLAEVMALLPGWITNLRTDSIAAIKLGTGNAIEQDFQFPLILRQPSSHFYYEPAGYSLAVLARALSHPEDVICPGPGYFQRFGFGGADQLHYGPQGNRNIGLLDLLAFLYWLAAGPGNRPKPPCVASGTAISSTVHEYTVHTNGRPFVEDAGPYGHQTGAWSGSPATNPFAHGVTSLPVKGITFVQDSGTAPVISDVAITAANKFRVTFAGSFGANPKLGVGMYGYPGTKPPQAALTGRVSITRMPRSSFRIGDEGLCHQLFDISGMLGA